VDPDELEATLLGAPCELTRDEVAAAAGIPEPEARSLWNAMGFAATSPDERAFTAHDVEALRTALSFAETGLVDRDTLNVLARAMGQELARTAQAQVEVFLAASDGVPRAQVLERAARLAPSVLPMLEQLVVHAWRRQFAAATARALAATDERSRPTAVGFVDLVDYTRASQRWDAATLERMLERFERETALRVTNAGGRVVKTLGDAVLFVADSADAAADVALATVEAHAGDDELPDVRAGVALGPVLVRLGDVFGTPVNLASRLTEQARPGSVLVDEETARALGDGGAYSLRRLRRRSVRGYRSLTPYLLRRTSVEG
jgi:adenylate cyclase